MKLKKEKLGWLNLSEKSLERLWNNKKDEKTWNKYIKKRK